MYQDVVTASKILKSGSIRHQLQKTLRPISGRQPRTLENGETEAQTP